MSRLALRPADDQTDAEEIRFQIAKLELGAGDVLVVKVASIGADQAEQLRRAVVDTLPDGQRFLIIDNSVDLSVLTATEIAARCA